MPVLKHIECSIELGPKNKKLREYCTRYGDAFVETYVAVPEENENFSVHLKTLCHISSGLSALVFIDGQIQCNKGKVNLKAHDDLTPYEGHGIDWRFTSKDESLDRDGWWIGREWSFQNLNIQDSEQYKDPNEAQSARGIGLIEVVVLRCRASTSSATNDTAPEANLDKGNVPKKGFQEDKASSVGLAGLFDGANDNLDGMNSAEMEFALDGPYDNFQDRGYYEDTTRRHRDHRRYNAPFNPTEYPGDQEHIGRRREHTAPHERHFTGSRLGSTDNSSYNDDNNYNNDNDPFTDFNDGARKYSVPERHHSSTHVHFDDDSDPDERDLSARRRSRDPNAYSQYMKNRELGQRQSARGNPYYQHGSGDAYSQYMANRELGQRHSRGGDPSYRYGSGDAYSQYMANRQERDRPSTRYHDSHQHRRNQNTHGSTGRIEYNDVPIRAEPGRYHRSRSIYGDAEEHSRPEQSHTDHSRQPYHERVSLYDIMYPQNRYNEEYISQQMPHTYEPNAPAEATPYNRYRPEFDASRDPNTNEAGKGNAPRRYRDLTPHPKTVKLNKLTHSLRPNALIEVPVEDPRQKLRSPIKTTNKRSPLRASNETRGSAVNPRVEGMRANDQVTGSSSPRSRNYYAASNGKREMQGAPQSGNGQNNLVDNGKGNGNGNTQTIAGSKENYTTPNWTNVQSKYDRISNSRLGNAAAGTGDDWGDKGEKTYNDENPNNSWENQDNSNENQDNSWENQDASRENRNGSWDKQGDQNNENHQENSWGETGNGNQNQHQNQAQDQNQGDNWADWNEQANTGNTFSGANNGNNKATGDWDKAPDPPPPPPTQASKPQQSNDAKSASTPGAAKPSASSKPLKLPKSDIGVIKPYWKNYRMGKHLSSSNATAHSGGAFPSRPPPSAWDGRGGDPYIAAAQPLPPVPRSVAQKQGLSHQVMAGKGAACYRRSGKPVYVDTVDAPYAVFVFKYRSKEMIEKLLPGTTVRPPREDKREKMMNMSKVEMMRELRRAKKLAGYETDSTLADDTDDDSEDGSDGASRPESKNGERKKNSTGVAERPAPKQEAEVPKKTKW